jgi:hypothetical protein
MPVGLPGPASFTATATPHYTPRIPTHGGWVILEASIVSEYLRPTGLVMEVGHRQVINVLNKHSRPGNDQRFTTDEFVHQFLD